MDENRAMLGVVTEEAENGVKVIEITDESAAKKAGIKEGDIITKVGDTKLKIPMIFQQQFVNTSPVKKLLVTLSKR